MKTKQKKAGRRSRMILEIIEDYNLRGVNPTTEEIRLELIERGAYEWNYGETAREKLQKREIISTVHKARDGKIIIDGEIRRVGSIDACSPDGTKCDPGWKQETLFDTGDYVQTIGKKVARRNHESSEIERLTEQAVEKFGPDVRSLLPSF